MGFWRRLLRGPLEVRLTGVQQRQREMAELAKDFIPYGSLKRCPKCLLEFCRNSWRTHWYGRHCLHRPHYSGPPFMELVCPKCGYDVREQLP